VQVTAELEDIEGRISWKEPKRIFLDDPNIQWRFGDKTSLPRRAGGIVWLWNLVVNDKVQMSNVDIIICTIAEDFINVLS
jgi:hypothetical protein